MRGGGIFAVALAAALACPAAFAAEPPRPLSNTEVSALSDADLIKLATAQIADFIETMPPDRHHAEFARLAVVLKLDAAAPSAQIAEQVRAHLVEKLAIYHKADDRKETQQPLREITVWTRPYEAASPGLCRSDTVILAFGVAGRSTGGDADAATPVAMYRLYVFPTYHALKAPASTVVVPARAAGQRDTDDATCKALNPRTQDFIGAFNDEDAVRGIWLRNQIDAALKQKVPPFELVCNDRTPAGKCRQTFEDDMKMVAQVRDCSAEVCVLGIDRGLRNAAVALEPGAMPKIKSITVTNIPPPSVQ
jgi:hypothetical protein